MPAPIHQTFPQPPRTDNLDDWIAWGNELVRRLTLLENQRARPASSSSYNPSNVTTDRSFDADSTTTAELADVVGTLIQDLQNKGIL